MRRQLVLILSIGLNGCLAIVLLSMLTHSKQGASTLATNGTAQTVVSNSVRNHVIVRKQFFTWDEMESSDYGAYVSNLLAIQCPPLTIRDIIVADVNQAYLYRRLTEIKDPLEEWWRSTPDPQVVEQNRRERSAMESQRRQFLDALLGTNWESASLPAQFNICMTGQTLGIVPAETKHRVLDIIQRAAQKRASFDLSLGVSTGEAVEAGYSLLTRQLEREMATVLTPNEFEEYLLRYSDLAAELREDFQDITIQRDEFLRIFRQVYPLRQQLLALPAGNPNYLADASDFQNRIAAVIRGILGSRRYSYYRMRTDNAYREAVADAGGLANSPKVVQALYKSLQTFEAESQRIMSDTNLTDVEKQEELAQLREQQLEEKDQILASDTGTTNSPPPSPPLPAPDTQHYQIHAYSPGETIDQIAAEYGVRPADILKANPNLNFEGLQNSTPIKVPLPKQ